MTEDTRQTRDSIDRRRLLKRGTGLATGALAITAVAGTVAAHFPETLTIDIVLKSGTNRIYHKISLYQRHAAVVSRGPY